MSRIVLLPGYTGYIIIGLKIGFSCMNVDEIDFDILDLGGADGI